MTSGINSKSLKNGLEVQGVNILTQTKTNLKTQYNLNGDYMSMPQISQTIGGLNEAQGTLSDEQKKQKTIIEALGLEGVL